MERFDILTAILGIVSLLALYWALFGQWKYNKMMREAEEPEEPPVTDKKEVKE